MNNIVPRISLVLLGSLLVPGAAEAYYGGGAQAGYLTSHLHAPSGRRYSGSFRTPPHFAVNPPVYYGRRDAGSSDAPPSATLALVTAIIGHQAQPAVNLVNPPRGPLRANPYCLDQLADSATRSKSGDEAKPVQGGPIAALPSPIEFTAAIIGPIRENPLASAAGVARQPHQRSLTR